MTTLLPVERVDDIDARYRNTPIERLLRYHNLEEPFATHTRPELLIGMCMDNRKLLRLPKNFAFVVRTGGANLRYSVFHLSYAIAVGGVEAIALIGHTQCGMAGLAQRREAFIQGMVEHAGWDRQRAEAHFTMYAPLYEIEDPVAFVLDETQSLRRRYPRVTVAPLLYRVEDDRLYQIAEA